MIDISKYWIEGIIQDKFREFQLDQGADLDGDGKIESEEKLYDYDQDGYIGSKGDYDVYLDKNRQQLSNIIPYFKWSAGLKIQNRIHQLIYLESDLFTEDRVKQVYEILTIASKKIKAILQIEELDNRTKAKEIYAILSHDMGYEFKESKLNSFIGSMTSLLKYIDCDISSFAVMTIADEINLQLSPVLAPGHIFLRGTDEEGKSFNIDFGNILGNLYYKKDLNISDQDCEKIGYLEPMSHSRLMANFFSLRALVLNGRGDYEEAEAVYSKAIELDPRMPLLYNNRILLNMRLKQYHKAFEDIKTLIELRPISSFYDLYADLLVTTERFHEALDVLDHLISMDPENLDAILLAARIIDENLKDSDKSAQQYYQNALEIIDRKLKIYTFNVSLYAKKATCLIGLQKYEEAVDTLVFAKALDRHSVDVLMQMCILYKQIGPRSKYQEALDECIMAMRAQERKRKLSAD